MEQPGIKAHLLGGQIDQHGNGRHDEAAKRQDNDEIVKSQPYNDYPLFAILSGDDHNRHTIQDYTQETEQDDGPKDHIYVVVNKLFMASTFFREGGLTIENETGQALNQFHPPVEMADVESRGEKWDPDEEEQGEAEHQRRT